MQRLRFIKDITDLLRVHPVCAILGPRQVGKTTLAQMFIKDQHITKAVFFDLENPLDLAQLENAMLTLGALPGYLIVIDKIQRRPELFPILRVLVDDPQLKQKYLILGSASRDLIRQSSETLAGRIGYLELPGFCLFETHESKNLWVRGGFPRSYLARDDRDSYIWRQQYITTFLERDIPNLGFSIPAASLRRFWNMIAHYHGQIFNASEIGKSLELSDNTVRKYLEILAGTFMVRILPPWFENIQKRQVKSPKLYFRDSGILHGLLGIAHYTQLNTFARLGSFWEGFALEQIISYVQATQEECYFWATHADAELDLCIIKYGKKIGFEFKYTQSPKITKSMHIALQDLQLDHLVLVYPGSKVFPLADKITAVGLDLVATGEFKSSLLF